jgi:MoaA/NifB/PqqE/SkfB family radical SAM enzyme
MTVATAHSTDAATATASAPATLRRAWTPEDLALLSRLRVITFFVTTVCNARCETCFYWENLNDDSDVLSLDEIKRLSASMPAFPHLLCSGGEPFMRMDFAEVLSTFVQNNKLFSITIPTNGLLTEKTVEVIRELKWRYPELMIELGFSFDGLAETHDRLRGVKENFRKSLDTVRAVAALRDEFDAAFPNAPHDRLLLLTNTCINTTNYREIPDFVAYMNEHAPLDGMMFEVIRGNPLDPDLAPPPMEWIERIHKLSIATNRVIMQRRDAQNMATKLSYLKSIYATQQARLRSGGMPIACQAGLALGVIEPNGDVRLCELLGTVGNLRDYNMDFQALWLDQRARDQQRWVIDTKCSCTHCVNLGHSIDANPTARWRRQMYERVARSGMSWLAA